MGVVEEHIHAFVVRSPLDKLIFPVYNGDNFMNWL